LKGKSKYYVVWKGVKPGVYSTWDECKAQTFGFEGPIFKSFTSLIEAEKAYGDDYKKYINQKPTTTLDKSKQHSNKINNSQIIKNSVAVDAACSGNPGDMEYQCVETISKKLIFHRGPFADGTNNVGEFLGLVHTLALLDKHQKHDVVIYTDSKTAMAWVKNKKAKTKLAVTSKNTILFEMIEKAENWLKANPIKNTILKWETEDWGEIPADFGRK
jgi:ribonuclease HI